MVNTLRTSKRNPEFWTKLFPITYVELDLCSDQIKFPISIYACTPISELPSDKIEITIQKII